MKFYLDTFFVLFYSIETYYERICFRIQCVINSQAKHFNNQSIKQLTRNWSSGRKQKMTTNTTPESSEQNSARAHRVHMRKWNEAATAIAADDELDIVVWRFEECKKLWKVVESKHEDYISTLDQTKHGLFKFSKTSWNSKGWKWSIKRR